MERPHCSVRFSTSPIESNIVDKSIQKNGIGGVALDEWAHCLPTLQLLNYIYHQGIFKGFLMFSIHCASFVLGFTPCALAVHHSAKQGGNDGSAPRTLPLGTKAKQAEALNLVDIK